MITFHNDHLVAPEFCKLIYDTVPEKLHRPVVFVPRTKKYNTFGTCFWSRIELYLQGIFYHGYSRGTGGEFGLWRLLLNVAYHEFGHVATRHLARGISSAEYDAKRAGYMRVEELAIDWADTALLKLAEHNKRLGQPKRLGAYFDGRILKIKNRERRWIRSYGKGKPPVQWLLEEYRRYKSGGQLTTAEVARAVNAWRYQKINLGAFNITMHGVEDFLPKPNTRLIRMLAADLAYIYIDGAGRKHMLFAWGDVPEIRRRVARHKAIHGPTPSELAHDAHYLDRRQAEKQPPPFDPVSVAWGELLEEIPF